MVYFYPSWMQCAVLGDLSIGLVLESDFTIAEIFVKEAPVSANVW